MDFQQPHRYMRPPPPPPPPPSMADAHHLQPPRQPAPPPGPWFPGQFQYHHPPSHHSPSPPPPPPPPHHPQWAPPHQSDHLPPPPYPPHQLHNQYPPLPPRPHVPPPLHPHAHIQQSYHHQVNQDWANPNQGNQGWEYPVHNNEEDWAARARAWAAAKSATDSLQPQSQFAPVVRQEEQSHYHDQYPQTVDPYYTDIPQPPRSSSSYQHYPPLTAPPHRPPVGHMHESAQSSYILDGHLPYTAGDRMLAGDTNAVFTNQESAHTSPAVHQQEVPSSYSSVTGREEAGDQSDKFYKSSALHMASTQGQYHVQPPVPAVGRSLSMEQSHYMFGNQSAEPTADLSDQPLDFAPRFSRGHDPHMQLNYTNIDSGGPIRGVDPVAPIASTHTWNPSVAPGVVYPPTPSGPQHDPSLAAPSPVSGHSAPIFGRMPIGAPFGIGTGAAFHPTTAFPGDVYGVSSVSERPKKASVPNWLREEIIKKKTVITTSAPDHLEDESQSIEDEGVDRSVGKGDHGDSKSADSSRSTEEEDDDEDYVEATRTAAINQEIKRVLTEVLLKVTDELFDEIATKVLSEGDLSVEVDHSNVAANHKVSPSTPSVPTPKASAQVLIPSKPKDTDSEDVSGKSVFSSPGDVLGLASYASDDDDDVGIQNSSIPNPKEHAIHQQPISRIVSEDIQGVENGSSQADAIEHDKSHAESDPSSGSPIEPTIHHGALVGEFPNKVEIFDGNKKIDGSDTSKSLTDSGVDVVMKTELPVVNDVAKNSVKDDSQGRETRDKPDKNDRRETRRSSSGKSFDKEVESGKNRTDERHSSKERVDSRKGSSRPDLKEDRKDRERDKRAGAKEDDRKKRAKDEKGDRSRTKHGSELSRQKRGRSSSVASKGRNGKDNSVVSDANLSSDEPSDDSKRKMHSKRRNLSPSPVRSRRRQVSRSPHSKHSQRRHSPYSSLETNRERRSRSRSPVRRQR